MITSHQMRAARALLGIDQRQLATLANVSLPTIQRMEACNGHVRGVIDTVMKIINALETAGIEFIGEHAASKGFGRGVRMRETSAGELPRPVPSILFDQYETAPEP